jgi:PST family polysaccharide transporter
VAAVTVALVAPWAAAYFREPSVGLVLRVLALNFPIAGICVVNQSLLQRHMRFGALAVAEVGAAAVGYLVGVTAALLHQGVWSLVYQSLAMNLATMVLLFAQSGFRPKFVMDLDELRSVRGYTGNLTGFMLVNYFARNADNLLVGRYLGDVSLGHYTMAYKVLLYPLRTITGLVGRVLFPAFSAIKDDHSAFRVAYLRAVGLISFLTFPLFLGVMALAVPAVNVVLSPKWQPVAPLILVLAPVGLVQSVVSSVGSIYTATGKTAVMFRVGLVSEILPVLGFAVGLHWGVLGVAVAYFVVEVSLSPFNLFFAVRQIELPLPHVLRPVWRPFLCAVGMALVLHVVSARVLTALGKGLGIGALALCGALVYAGLSWWVNRKQAKDLILMACARV